jgi:hypothetical protein
MPKKLKLSHSSMECFRQCPHKYYLSRIERIFRAEEPRQLAFGTAFHKALEPLWELMGLEEALSAWQRFSRNLSAEDRIVGDVMLRAYHAKWGDHEHEYAFVENRFEVPVIGPDGEVDESMTFIGYMDVEVPHGPIDHKTTRSDLSKDKYRNRLEREPQAEEYLIACQDKGGGSEYAMWDVIRCPELKMRTKTPEDKQQFYKQDGKHGKKGDPKPGTYLENETAEQFRLRFYAMVANNPDAYLQRYRIEKTEAQLDRRRYDIWATGKLIQAAIAAKAFPRAENGCGMFDHGDGRNMCEYEPICWQGVDPYQSESYIVGKKREA